MSPRNKTPRTVAISRVHRSQKHKFSTTGTDLAHIETIEADRPLQQFPAFLAAQIKEYLELNADKGENIELTFAKNGNTKLSENADGSPAYFVIPNTQQKLDAGRYKYGVTKGSPLIVVVQEKRNSLYSFNNGEPAIIRYYGKHSKITGADKVSKWAVWSIDGLRTDIAVWRVSEGARLQSAQPVIEEVNSDSENEYYDETRESIDNDDWHSYRATAGYEHAHPTSGATETYTWRSGTNLMQSEPGQLQIDPQLFLYRDNLLVDQKPFIPREETQSLLADIYQVPPHNGRLLSSAHRRSKKEQILGIMAKASGAVNNPSSIIFHFRVRMDQQSRVCRSLEHIRTMPKMFAYGIRDGTIAWDHHVVSIHFINSETNRNAIHLIRDDEGDWQLLMSAIEDEQYKRQVKMVEIKDEHDTIDLVVLDEGY